MPTVKTPRKPERAINPRRARVLDRDQMIVLLVDKGGHTYREIASRFGLTFQAVAKAYNRTANA